MSQDFPVTPSNPAPNSPVTHSPTIVDEPSSPESFATPPSSPLVPNVPAEVPPDLPETPRLPRRSTRVNLGRPPDRLNYDKF